jgi:hypothetical protein
VSDPEFLDVDDVLALHERQISEFGGSPGIRDRGVWVPNAARPPAVPGRRRVLGEF